LRAGIQVQPLLELPLILLVHKKSRLARAEELWKHDKIEETLITFPRSIRFTLLFSAALSGLEWNGFGGIEVNSARFDRALRRERLWDWLGSGGPRFQARRRRARFAVAGFSPVVVGASWSGKLSNISKQLLAELEAEAQVQNAPNEKWKPALSLSLLPLLWRVNRTSSSIDLIWSRNSGVFWWPCARSHAVPLHRALPLLRPKFSASIFSHSDNLCNRSIFYSPCQPSAISWFSFESGVKPPHFKAASSQKIRVYSCQFVG